MGDLATSIGKIIDDVSFEIRSTSSSESAMRNKPDVDRTYRPQRFWEQRISSGGDLSSVGHPELGAYNRLAYVVRQAALRRALGGVEAKLAGTRIFEVAFGVGYYLEFWSDRGAGEVTGIDLSPSAVEVARRRFPGYVLFQHDVTRPLPESMGRYGLVTAIDVLYHVVDDEDWRRAVRHVSSLVAPGGLLVLTDKFPQGAATSPSGAVHVRRRPLEEYEEELRKGGLVIEKIVPVFVFMDDPILCGVHRWIGAASSVQWRAVSKLIRVCSQAPAMRDAVGLAVGALQLPLELLSARLLKRSPNLEMLVCRHGG